MLTCADVCRILCDACGGSAALLERVRALFARFIYVFLDIQGPDVDEVLASVSASQARANSPSPGPPGGTSDAASPKEETLKVKVEDGEAEDTFTEMKGVKEELKRRMGEVEHLLTIFTGFTGFTGTKAHAYWYKY